MTEFSKRRVPPANREHTPPPVEAALPVEKELTYVHKKYIFDSCFALVQAIKNGTFKGPFDNLLSKIDSENDEIILREDNFLYRLRGLNFKTKEENLSIDFVGVKNLDILTYIDTLSFEGVSFDVILTQRGEQTQAVLKLTNATTLIDSMKQKEQEKAEADFDKLIKIVFETLDIYNGKKPGSIATRYFRSGNRLIVRGNQNSQTGDWESLGVIPLLNSIGSNNSTLKQKFITIMENAGYKNPFFGSVNDGDPQRYWIEFSWEDQEQK